MKKFFVLVALVAFTFSNNFFAQGITSKGVAVGLNMSNVSGKEIKNNSMKLGFAIGGFLTYSINRQLAIRPEIYYSAKGFELKWGEATLTVSYNYIDIPILGVYSINRNINVFAGPYVDIYLSGSLSTSVSNETEDIKSDEMTIPGFGLTFGGEYRLNQFSAGARFNLGLSDIASNTNESEGKYTHSVIQIILGYYL